MNDVLHRTVSENLVQKILIEDRYALEMQNASMAIIVGFVFLLDTVHLYHRYPDTYKYMEFFPAWVWGFLYFSVGAFHIICLFTGFRYLRKQVLLAKSALWVFIATCVIAADAWAVSGYFYLLFAFFAFRGFLRIQVWKIDVWKNE
jgi:hypothetical protein